MPRLPKKPLEEWEAQRQRIRDYYIGQDMTLKDTMQLMQTNHSFDATKREYVKRLEEWGFSKYSKTHDRVCVRESARQRQVTRILNGQSISDHEQRVVNARFQLEPEVSFRSVMGWECGREITIRTSQPSIRIFTSSVPWFQTQRQVSPLLESMAHEIIPSLDWIGTPGPQLIQYTPARITLEMTESLITKLLGVSCYDTASILQRLQNLLPHDDEADRSVVFNDPIFLLFQSCIYLSSNGKLVANDMRNFLNWILESGITPLFTKFLRRLRTTNSTNMEIFFHRLFSTAIQLEKEDVLDTLLAHGIDPNYNSYPGPGNLGGSGHVVLNVMTPLQQAVIRCNLKICRLLLQYQAHPDAISYHLPVRPLDLAVTLHHGSFPIAEELVAKGADVHLPCAKGYYEVNVHGVLARYRLDPSNLFQSTLLIKAVETQNINIVRMLLGCGLSPKSIIPSYGTPLQVAVMKNDLEMVDLLLQRGADVNLFDKSEYSVKSFFMHCLDEIEDDEDENYNKYKYDSLPFSYAKSIGNFARKGGFLSPIEIATWNDNHDMVQHLLQAGATINQTLNHSKIWHLIPKPCGPSEKLTLYRDMERISKEAFTPVLHRSVQNGNIDLARLLLHHDLSEMVNCHNANGLTPLELACGLREDDSRKLSRSELCQRRVCLARVLIGFGADVNSSAGSALRAAVKLGDEELVQLLVAHGADLKGALSAKGGMAAVEGAAMAGNLSLITCLEKHGVVSSSSMTYIHRVLLHAAASRGDLPAVKELLGQGIIDVNAQGSPSGMSGLEETVLQASVGSGNIGTVQALLDHGADPNTIAKGETALCTAARLRHVAILDILLLHGADPNRDAEVTPLAIAAVDGCFYKTLTLLRPGCDADQVSQHPKREISQEGVATPLVWVMKELHKFYGISRMNGVVERKKERLRNICLLLLSYGADPNAKLAGGGSVLTFACGSRECLLVKEAVIRGANVNLPNREDGYPIQAAILSNDEEIVQFLLDAGADVNAPAPSNGRNALDTAFFYRASQKIAKLIIAAGANDACAHLADMIRHGWHDWALELIQDGANIDRPGPVTELTPLQAAATCGSVELVRLLLDHGADANARQGPRRWTPLQSATSWTGNYNVVKLLVEKGADINAPAPFEVLSYGVRVGYGTALQNAAGFGCLDIAYLLLENDRQADTLESRCKDAAEIAEMNGHSILARELRNYASHHGLNGRRSVLF